MSSIPKNPVMLMSYLNTHLRDNDASLEELCRSLDLDQAEVEKKLAQIDYHYEEGSNQFK